MRTEVIKANLCVFIASFCTLVIELVAGRIMAPHVGVSLYTWTSIIGVVLAGISVGAYLGGVLADRFPHYATLGWLLLLSGLAAFSIGPVADLCREGSWLGTHGLETSLMTRILILTSLIFFLPALVLGMISPVVVRLTVRNLEQTGNVVGKIYAFSTLGSILGTFATGFFLVAYMGTRLILFSVGVVLVLCAPVFGGLFARRRGLRAALVLTCLGLLTGWLVVLCYVPALEAAWLAEIRRPVAEERAPLTQLYASVAKPFGAHRPDWPYYYHKESDYYTIRLWTEDRDDGGGQLEVLSLDQLKHSLSDLDDPLYLQYDYLTIYEELVAWATSWQTEGRRRARTLFIGGGGYTFPRLMERRYPLAELHVVEIDPEVTRVALDYLGVGRDTRIRTFNMDGRWYVMNCKEPYDLIIGEAFNDVSIPYHLTTKEFAAEIKAILKSDGLLIALVIDSIKAGQFMPAYIRTLEEVFGKGHVHLITLFEALNEACDNIGMRTHVIVASRKQLDWRDFEAFRSGPRLPQRSREDVRSFVVRPDILQRYLQLRGGVVLTDDYAPVDYLIAPLFEERFSGRPR